MALPLYTIASNGGHGFNPHGLSSSKERERERERVRIECEERGRFNIVNP